MKDNSIKVYIPVDGKGSYIYTEEALEYFCELFGGSTGISCMGYWKNSAGVTEKESVTTVNANMTADDLNAHLNEIYDYIRELKIKLEQEKIAIEINNELQLI